MKVVRGQKDGVECSWLVRTTANELDMVRKTQGSERRDQSPQLVG